MTERDAAEDWFAAFPRGAWERGARGLALVALGIIVLAATAGCGPSANTDPEPDYALVKKIRETGGGAGAEDGAAEAVAGGTGWGTLTGRFVYQGDPPSVGNLSAQVQPADRAACGQHPIPNETLIVDPSTKGIANVLVYARKVSRVHEETLNSTKAVPAIFDQKECIFLSHVLPVMTGQTVFVKNSDPVSHNSNISPPGTTPFNPIILGHTQVEYKFRSQQTEPVPVTCNIHNWMRAYIIPRKDPYCVVTAEDGAFTIANLPAGEEIEFQVWHERGSGDKGALSAGPINSQGRFKATIKEDGATEDLETIEVPPSAFTR